MGRAIYYRDDSEIESFMNQPIAYSAVREYENEYSNIVQSASDHDFVTRVVEGIEVKEENGFMYVGLGALAITASVLAIVYGTNLEKAAYTGVLIGVMMGLRGMLLISKRKPSYFIYFIISICMAVWCYLMEIYMLMYIFILFMMVFGISTYVKRQGAQEMKRKMRQENRYF